MPKHVLTVETCLILTSYRLRPQAAINLKLHKVIEYFNRKLETEVFLVSPLKQFSKRRSNKLKSLRAPFSGVKVFITW